VSGYATRRYNSRGVAGRVDSRRLRRVTAAAAPDKVDRRRSLDVRPQDHAGASDHDERRHAHRQYPVEHGRGSGDRVTWFLQDNDGDCADHHGHNSLAKPNGDGDNDHGPHDHGAQSHVHAHNDDDADHDDGDHLAGDAVTA
jgi:hypothetical protein